MSAADQFAVAAAHLVHHAHPLHAPSPQTHLQLPPEMPPLLPASHGLTPYASSAFSLPMLPQFRNAAVAALGAGALYVNSGTAGAAGLSPMDAAMLQAYASPLNGQPFSPAHFMPSS